MNLRFIYNSYLERRRLNPTRKFKKQLLVKLEDRIAPSVGYVWYREFWVKYAVSGVAGFVGVASVATSVYAYSSPSVTEGTMLYPLKKAVETLEETTKTTPEAKAKFYLKQVARREAEKEVIAKTVPAAPEAASTTPDVIPALQKTDDAIEEAEHELANVQSQLDDTNNDKELKKAIEKHLNRREKNKVGSNNDQVASSTEENEDDKNTSENTITNINTSTPNEQGDEAKEKKKNRGRSEWGRKRGEWRFEIVTTTPEVYRQPWFTTTTLPRRVVPRPYPIEPIEPPLQPEHENESTYSTSSLNTTSITPVVSTTVQEVKKTTSTETTDHTTTTEKIETHKEEQPKVEIIEYHNSSSTEI